jgi:purine-cytosine permease-like protein
MSEVPGQEPPRDEAEQPPAPSVYPPPYVTPDAAAPGASDEELAAALAAQTAMYTGPITIPVINSDPTFRPDPSEVQPDLPPPLPVPPPPPAPEYVAPDDVASDPESVDFGLPDDVVVAEPVPPPPLGTSHFATPAAAPFASTFVDDSTATEAPVVDGSPVADDELSRTVEEEAAAGSTLDAILLLENELRRRQGMEPVVDSPEPPLDVGAAFGANAWDAAAVAAPPATVPGWTDAPDPHREAPNDAYAPPVAPVDGSTDEPLDQLGEPLGEPADGPVAAPVAETPPPDDAWLTAPPPAFEPPALVEPPAAAEVGTIDPTSLTPPPVSELPAPVLPPPVTTVEGPDGPIDVTHLPPPAPAAAVEVPVAGFQDAPPPDVAAVPTMPPPPAEAFVVSEVAGDPEAEGIDDLDRADLAAPIPVDEAGIASVVPVPASTATMVAVGEPVAAGEPTDPPAIGIESAALEPTPVERRAGHAARLFWLWFAANSSIVMIAVSATLFTFGMSLRQVLVAVVAGVGLSALPLGLGSLAGKWSGQPTMVVSRATFGLIGNVLPAVLAVIGRVLWGAILLWLLAVTAAAVLAPSETGLGVTAFVALAIGAVVAGIVAVLGYGLLHRVQRVLGILSTVLVAATIVVTASHVDIETALRTDDGPWMLAIGGAVLVFSVVGLAWAQSSSDLARYQKTAGSGAANMLWGSFGVIVPTLAILSWGAILAASDPELADDLARAPLATLIELVPEGLALPVLAAAGFGLVAGAIVTMYSGGLALVAAGVRLPRSLATVIASVLVVVVAVLLLILGSDTRALVVDVATTVAVPVAAWTGIFASEMMIRLRRFHGPSLLAAGGVYPTVRWVNLVGLVVISGIGFGLVTAHLAGFTWEGYLFTAFGVEADSVLATSDIGVLVALALGLLLPLVAGVPAIRRQERDRDEAEGVRPAASPLVD